MPIVSSRRRSQAGLSAIFTPRITRAVKRGQRSGQLSVTLVRSVTGFGEPAA